MALRNEIIYYFKLKIFQIESFTDQLVEPDSPLPELYKTIVNSLTYVDFLSIVLCAKTIALLYYNTDTLPQYYM